ncbi:MAG TPA: DNA polymerase III subunit [Pyrinomonadaceae bacterium]|nr:DNA polymerase III subunit [Pyrinomonadaceae bacterium]
MFSSLVGNQRAQETLRRMLSSGRVPGALLFAGEDGVGKKQFALELARALNCNAPRVAEACGVCPACTRIGRFKPPAADDRDAHKRIVWTEHGDVGLILPYNRSIYVDAARELERETNFRPFEGRARVFIIEDADLLGEANKAAANALLKTLEEPSPTSHIVLVTARPASVLSTIRSRCQAVRFAPLAPHEIEEHLVKTHKRSGEEARLAAHISRGRLAHALALNLDDYRAEREQMLAVVEALAPPGDRARLLRASEELADPKRKDAYESRLDLLETLVHDLWLLALDPSNARVVNEDLRERLARLGERVGPRRPARWLTHIEALRGQLVVNVNRRAATDALLLTMEEEKP